jgi:O-antigen/teichoic acid export membrane protein
MVLLNLLVKPLWIFFVDRKVQLIVGDNSYGLYAALLNLTILFNILLDVGITNYNSREVAMKKTGFEVSLPNMLIAKLLLTVLYFCVIFFVAYCLHYSSESLHLLLFIGAIQFLNSMLLFLRSTISANQAFKMDSILSVADKLFMLIVCSFILYVLKTRDFTIYHYIYVQLLAYSIVIILALGYIFIYYTSFNIKAVKSASILFILKQSLPYALLVLLMGVYMRSDGILIERLLPKDGKVQTGIYMYSFRILDILNSIAVLFATMLLPMFSKLIANKYKVNELVITAMNILMPVSLSIAAFSVFYNSDIIQFLYHNSHVETDAIFTFVVFSFPAFCLVYIYSTLLTANGNINLLIRISVITAVLSLVLNYFLITQYKALGASYTLCIVEWFVALMCIVFSIKKFSFNINIKWLLKFVIVFVFYIVLNYIVKNLLHSSLLIALIMNCIFFLPLVYCIKLWNITTFKQYFTSNNV